MSWKTLIAQDVNKSYMKTGFWDQISLRDGVCVCVCVCVRMHARAHTHSVVSDSL